MTLLSPGIELKENSTQSTIVQNATGRAAMVGKFQWGPAFKQIQITNEVELTEALGYPDVQTADYFMSAANFLNYGNDLRVVRAVNVETARNSSPLVTNINWTITAGGSNYAVGDTIKVKYMQTTVEDQGKVTEVDTDGRILSIFIPSGKIVDYARSIGQYPQLSDSWVVEIESVSSGISGAISVTDIIIDSGIVLTSTDKAAMEIQKQTFQDALKKYHMPAIAAAYPGELGDQIEIEIVSKKHYDTSMTVPLNIYPAGGTRLATTKAVFGYGPQTENQYAFIVRRNGAIVEQYILSTSREERDMYGSNIFINDYFQRGASRYIFASALNWPKDFSGIIRLGGGTSANASVTTGDLMQAWDKFADRESLYVNLMIAGAVAGESAEMATTVQKHASAIGETRKDCLVLISPPRETVVGLDTTVAVDNLIDWRTAQGAYELNNMNISTTYSFIDGNYKYQYDKYNDVNRWVPLAADIAGLCARTDTVANPWMSPAGYNRGQILNCIGLALETREAQRDRMYQEAINPVVGSDGEGYVLLGDKTATKVPTPFDRVNVRRLFNMLKKNIGSNAKYKLFEINSAFTRNSFTMETTQYLDGIEALGGMYDSFVICNETNNTPSVIDRNEFVGTMMIKPARSINFITLNFVATSTGADFQELVGGALV